MNPFALFLTLGSGIGLLFAPRKWAAVPLLIGCCYMTMGQGLEVGPITLPVYRLLLLFGIIRVITKSEWLYLSTNAVDKLMIFWASWVFLAGFFHEGQPGSGPIYNSGQAFDLTLFYFLLRIWLNTPSTIELSFKVLALLLVPIAITMVIEQITSKNLFSIFGGVPETSLVRNGRLRAQGPFRHPILAGTVGATCIPLFIILWNKYRKVALVGIIAGLLMVLASSSSGPVLSVMVGCSTLVLWKFRTWVGTLQFIAVIAYVVLSLVMDRPPYYLIAEIDITGGSTGWHRAFLIEQTIAHFDEWWLFGTDRTRHWMPAQGAISAAHTDVTNYYIGFAISGGLLSMLAIIFMLYKSFRYVGDLVRAHEFTNPTLAFFSWSVGCCLLSHTITGMSVGYFDQSRIFIWLCVAIIGSLWQSYFFEQAEENAFDEEGDYYDEIPEHQLPAYGYQQPIPNNEPPRI